MQETYPSLANHVEMKTTRKLGSFDQPEERDQHFLVTTMLVSRQVQDFIKFIMK